MASDLKNRQDKVLNVNSKIKEFDLNQIKSDDIQNAKDMVDNLTANWNEIKNKLEQKL